MDGEMRWVDERVDEMVMSLLVRRFPLDEVFSIYRCGLHAEDRMMLSPQDHDEVGVG